MIRPHYAVLVACAALAVLGGPLLDVVAVAGAAVTGFSARRERVR